MSKIIILGLMEKIAIFNNKGKKEKVVARIDTGATSSSMDARLSSKLGLNATSKTKLIKSASGVKRRPVVHAQVQLNGDIIDAEFTIADRSHMRYSVLLGQNVLRQGPFLIDPKKGEESFRGG